MLIAKGHAGDGVALLQQTSGQKEADESGGTGDEYTHDESFSLGAEMREVDAGLAC